MHDRSQLTDFLHEKPQLAVQVSGKGIREEEDTIALILLFLSVIVFPA
jgi:hypothetical protein